MRDSLRQLVLTRFREFGREPEAVFWSLAFPILLTVGLGIAFRNRPAEVVHVAVIGDSAAVAHAITALNASKAVAAEHLPDADARLALRTGRIALVVNARGANRMEYEYDETRDDARTARLLVDDAIQRGGGRSDPVAVSQRFIREPGSRYIDFVVPGLLGMGLMGNGIWGIGFPVVDARRKGLLKRFMATPMSRAEYLASFVISRFALLIIEIFLLVGFSALAFGVPLRGSFIELTLVCALGALAFGALGLLIAARPRTVEGASGLMNLAMMPMWILSGVFFSSENFPRAIQPFIQALPLTAVNDALRANMLRGAGLGVVGPELAIIAAWFVGCFLIALRLFRWR
ncbi:MAG TPA: ABC transporter permease [Gemmatimonadaceae bacterium]|nr:ABC transporter permease [Gemmatimonadaceae bacterium]